MLQSATDETVLPTQPLPSSTGGQLFQKPRAASPFSQLISFGRQLTFRETDHRFQSDDLYCRHHTICILDGQQNGLSKRLPIPGVVLLVGPRQAGKTTFAQAMACAGRAYRPLDNATALAAVRSDPSGFVRNLDRAVIDEMQRAREGVLRK